MITALLLVAAAEAAATPLTLQPVLLGLLVVAVAYALVAIGSLRRQVAGLSAANARPVAAPKAAPVPAPASVPEDLTPELIALITAAVHLTLGGRHRIVALSAADQRHADQRAAWSAEGRREVFQSHRVR